MADIVAEWIKCVIQAARPWISTQDLETGTIWFSEINDQLKKTTAGIVCITNDNKDNPWILYETGALAKGLTTSRVHTFLIDLKPEDLASPLSQFNATLPNRASMWKLVRSLNSGTATQLLDDTILAKVFATYWPQFEESFKDALDKNPPVQVPEPRSDNDILVEILQNSRSLSHRVIELESKMNNRADASSDVLKWAEDLLVSSGASVFPKGGSARLVKLSDMARISELANPTVIKGAAFRSEVKAP